MIATESIEEINRKLEALPPEHPAKYPHGLFLKAKENLWGNIVIGLGTGWQSSRAVWWIRSRATMM